MGGRSKRATADLVLHELAAMHSEGVVTLRANSFAERLWPGRRHHNANGQVFHLGAATAARLLRACPAVREKEHRLWEILPHRLPAIRGMDDLEDARLGAAALEAHHRSGKATISLDQVIKNLDLAD